jgi:hypothetical protein
VAQIIWYFLSLLIFDRLFFPIASKLVYRHTAFGFVGIAFGQEKLLVFSAESKGSAAIGAPDGLILKTHWMAASLYN